MPSSLASLGESTESQASTPRLVFQEEARGVPSLQRGWRTPDPSPLRREAAELPRCKAKQVGVVFARGDRSRDCSPSPRDDSVGRIRTPSPDGRYCAAQTPPSSEDESPPLQAATAPMLIACATRDLILCAPCVRVVPSIGSVGHPFSCAEPCKYFSKSSKGCKDGANCNRCHLCEWKRQKAPAAEPPAAEPPSVEEGAASRRPAHVVRRYARLARGTPTK